MRPQTRPPLFTLALCLLLAACSWGDRKQFPQPSSPTSTSFTVATYNLFKLNHDQRLGGIFRKYPFIDVWLFQEAAPPIGIDETATPQIPSIQPIPNDLAAILPEAYRHRTCLMARPNGDTWEFLAVASRFEIIEARILQHPNGANRKDYLALACVVRAPAGRAVLVNVHHGTRPGNVGPLDRDRQAQALLETLAPLRREFPNTPFIIAGDFNTSGNLIGRAAMTSTEEIERLNARMADAGFNPLPASEKGSPTFTRLTIDRRLDHFFFRGAQCEAWRVEDELGPSDHRPVWARFSPIPQDSIVGLALSPG